MSVLLTIIFDLLVAEGEGKGEENEMLLHDMSIKVIHFMWCRAVANDKCMFLVQL